MNRVDHSAAIRAMAGRLLAVLALAVAAWAGHGGPAVAGSVVAELEWRFPCETGNRRRVELTYDGFSAASVALNFEFDEPVLSINEKMTFEQPFELVAFEYFAACELARHLDAQTFVRLESDADLARDYLVRADCVALSALGYEGIMTPRLAYSMIEEFYGFRKPDETYLDIPFWQRAANIRERCRL